MSSIRIEHPVAPELLSIKTTVKNIISEELPEALSNAESNFDEAIDVAGELCMDEVEHIQSSLHKLSDKICTAHEKWTTKEVLHNAYEQVFDETPSAQNNYRESGLLLMRRFIEGIKKHSESMIDVIDSMMNKDNKLNPHNYLYERYTSPLFQDDAEWLTTLNKVLRSKAKL